MKKIFLISIVFIALAQITMLGIRIYKYENILKNGKTFYFQLAPIDPVDTFKGKYIMLNFKLNKIAFDDTFKKLKFDDIFYIGIKKENNSTIIKKVYLTKPKKEDYLQVHFIRRQKENIIFRLPFDRFYMNEEKAKKAENIYNNLTKKDNFTAEVKVLDGLGVIKDIKIKNISLKDYIK